MIRGVIFDLDGLLFNTETLFLASIGRFLEKRGLEVPEEELKTMIGTDNSRAKELDQQYPGIAEVMKEYMNRRLELFDAMFPHPGDADMKGLDELIPALEKEGIPYAIASGSAEEDIHHFMNRAGVEMHPAALVSTRSEHLPGKPHPDVFLKAAEKLGLAPEEALVCEDGKYGILAAKAGGFPSVFIQDKIVPDEEMKAALQYQTEDLSQVLDLIHRLNGKKGAEE